MSSSTGDLFADRPATVFVEGVGEVPVLYADSDGDDVFAAPLPPVDLESRFRLAPGIEWAAVGEGFVLWNPGNSTSHVLDPMAGLLWQCMDGVGTVREIFSDVSDAFSVPVAQVLADFEPAVAAWVRDGFVVDGDGEPPTADATPGTRWAFLADPPND